MTSHIYILSVSFHVFCPLKVTVKFPGNSNTAGASQVIMGSRFAHPQSNRNAYLHVAANGEKQWCTVPDRIQNKSRTMLV